MEMLASLIARLRTLRRRLERGAPPAPDRNAKAPDESAARALRRQPPRRLAARCLGVRTEREPTDDAGASDSKRRFPRRERPGAARERRDDLRAPAPCKQKTKTRCREFAGAARARGCPRAPRRK